MAKRRIVASEQEQSLVELTRELTKLQARRRQKVEDLEVLDQEIEGVNQQLHSALPPVAPTRPSGTPPAFQTAPPGLPPLE